MKRLVGLIVILLVAYAVYNDMTIGTLPAANPQMIEASSKYVNAEKENSDSSSIPFFEHTVKPGDTVLSVLDSNSIVPLAVSVTEAIQDFKALNEGVDPHNIKFGKTYKFPDYSKNNKRKTDN